MNKVCYICGRVLEKGAIYYSMGDNTYVCHNESCLRTSFWDRIKARVKGDTHHEYVVADNKVYQIGSDNDSPRGSGGRHYIVRFHDGQIKETNSLWCIGECIPWNERKYLPDNAVFIYAEENNQ